MSIVCISSDIYVIYVLILIMGETVLVGAGAVFVYFVFGLNALSHVRKPSMCSKRFGLMFV